LIERTLSAKFILMLQFVELYPAMAFPDWDLLMAVDTCSYRMTS
jgi:hypothetical protein